MNAQIAESTRIIKSCDRKCISEIKLSKLSTKYVKDKRECKRRKYEYLNPRQIEIECSNRSLPHSHIYTYRAYL